MSVIKNTSVTLPAWLPEDVTNFLMHRSYGVPIRQLARQLGCHASTILRQVRKIEERRTDPLLSAGLDKLSTSLGDGSLRATNQELLAALRHLAQPGAFLVVAPEMEGVAILTDDGSHHYETVAKIDRRIAEVLALRDWIGSSTTSGRIFRYRITTTGRAGLRDLVALSENRARSLACETPDDDGSGTKRPPRRSGAKRVAAIDTPVRALSRRRGKTGEAFLSMDMVHAAERLREDFEVAYIGMEPHTHWPMDYISEVNDLRRTQPGYQSATDARARVEAAFTFLGPGLAEIVYRTCCLVEGLEVTEQRMGWAARSGKVVLRIALLRLVLHYSELGSDTRTFG